MESYVVSIYRSGKKPDNLTGTVEKPGDYERKSFAGVEELWDILISGKVQLAKPSENKKNSK